ncbi:MAG TPA: hypothetical protein VFJ57_07805 [Solirubrobacterales bacterium]|nr:hypothetical protein [Solirubrobacterales bacterium]
MRFDPRLGFSDHHRQRYAAKVRLPGDGEFLIGSYYEDGSVTLDGEFAVTLVGREGLLFPCLVAFGEAAGALQRALDAGLLDVLGSVGSRDEFSRRLIAIGIIDRSDERLPAESD